MGEAEAPGAALRQLLIAVGDPLVDVLAAPRGFDIPVRDVVILDPDDQSDTHTGELVLVIGARGRSAIRLVRAAARRGAAAVAVKVDEDGDVDPLRDAAIDGGVALLGVRPEVRWEQLESLARSTVDNARLTTDADTGEALGDLFALAQTVAAMTDGIVSIEDASSRVLAYSRSDDEVDELRRLSVLGRRGPEQYLAMLRQWGVYQRLRGGDEVVHIDPRPELGIRRRLAVGIHAGAQFLGTIWVQEGAHAFTERSERALLGAGRVAALHLIRERTQVNAAPRFRENLLTGLLDGRINARSVAENIGADAAKPAAVVVFTLRPDQAGTVSDRSELELQRTEMTSLISVHAAAYRRSALVTTLGSRVYALLPDLAERAAESAIVHLSREIVTAAARHLRVRVQVAVGSAARTLEGVAASRVEADRVLDAMAHDLGTDIATIADVRARALVSEMLTLVHDSEHIRDPRVSALVEHDAEHGTEFARSLLAYLESFGDVRSAANQLRVHPNTLRYRVRRATELAGLDLDEPAERLSTHLLLLLARREGGS